MRKFLFLVFLSIELFSYELGNFLSPNYSELFGLQLQKSKTQEKLNSLSWISPIIFSFQRNWSNQIEGGWHPYNSYSIGIEQPIFKSGGIFFGIKYAKSSYYLAKYKIIQQKVNLNTQAAQLLFQIEQTKLNLQKLKLQIKNSNIEIKKTKELFDAGLYGSEVLENALVRGDEANIAYLNLEAELETLKAAFKKISNRDLNNISLPKLRLLSLQEYMNNNLDIKIALAKRLSSKYYKSVVRSKYLPTISVGARYTKISNAKPQTKDAFTNYNLKISMPISINMKNDLEIAKLDNLISQIDLKNIRKAQKIEYQTVLKRLKIINNKIKLSKKEANAYKRLLKSTKELYRAGQKSIDDVNMIKNSLKIKLLDIKIFKIQKDLELLKLYSKVDI